MKAIKLITSEQKMLKKVKKELLTDRNATFKSQSKNLAEIQKVAEKYGVDSQIIYDSIL
jgi:hypothetical protein